MTPRIPTDDQLHCAIRGYSPHETSYILATAELARRAAASEGFAAGDVVTAKAWKGEWTVASGSPLIRIHDKDGYCLVLPPSDLTHAPPAPTAIEVFAAAYDADGGCAFGVERGAAFNALRRVLRAAGIPADEPLATGGAL